MFMATKCAPDRLRTLEETETLGERPTFGLEASD
jgi:hypothetical protein